jgi:hypothetical protein
MAIRTAGNKDRGQDSGERRAKCLGRRQKALTGCVQGFDEFMNLVIDDAVEVKQITKTNDKETRRSLGRSWQL